MFAAVAADLGHLFQLQEPSLEQLFDCVMYQCTFWDLVFELFSVAI